MLLNARINKELMNTNIWIIPNVLTSNLNQYITESNLSHTGISWKIYTVNWPTQKIHFIYQKGDFWRALHVLKMSVLCASMCISIHQNKPAVCD